MNGEPKYVTLVSGESPCRGLDGLTDGFMRWFGKERVRPHLMMGPSCEKEEFSYFQPVYQWAKEGSWSWQPSESELLIVSTRAFEKVSEWMNQQGFHCAMATVDVRDTPYNETLGLDPCASIQVPFKLELGYTTLSTEIYSCPIGLVPETLPPLKSYGERTIPVSFLAGISNVTRSALASAVKSIPGSRVELGTNLPRQEYLQLLCDSKISIACYGAGFNSYRYWEIPACGALLVAQAMPLLIPHNFQNGVHALFYTSPPELLRTLEWAFQHPSECEAMTRAGMQHVMMQHTTINRAKYVSDVMRAKMQIKGGEQFLTQFPF